MRPDEPVTRRDFIEKLGVGCVGVVSGSWQGVLFSLLVSRRATAT
ncbi:MAG TPA: hypothetical protein DDZ51_00360 [Planctomycetaceae bacterium]|nr:hypothetical protein [Planctomycetaceae bacterium]